MAADSFAAVEQRIDREHRLSYAALDAHMNADYRDEDGERVRQLMYHGPRYGGGETLGDAWAVRISKL